MKAPWLFVLSYLSLKATSQTPQSNLNVNNNFPLAELERVSRSRQRYQDDVVELQREGVMENPNALICLGSVEDLSLPAPMFGQVGWGTDSTHRLCAEVHSLDVYVPWVNGRCLLPTDSRPRNLIFRPPVQATRYSPPRRIELWCQNRCFCAADIGPNGRKPKDVSAGGASFLRPSDLTYVTRIDIGYPWNEPMGSSSSIVTAVKLREQPQSTRYGEGSREAKDAYLSAHRLNRIYCDNGPFPDFELPDPYSYTDFGNLQKLCAAQILGGNPGANAGMYCHPMQVHSGSEGYLEPWHSEEMTPRVEWTLRSNYRFAIPLISHCQRFCHCTRYNDRDGTANPFWEPNKNIWNVAEGKYLVIQPDNTIFLGSVISSPSTINLELPGSGSQDSTTACGRNITANCPDPWPTELLGPVPSDPPWGFPVVRKKIPATPDTCGKTCTKMTDCGSGGSRCKCRVTNPAQAREAGLDPVFPMALCMAVITGFVINPTKSKQHPKSYRSLDGRSVHQAQNLIDEDGHTLPCPCNTSYISQSCCSAGESGLVWEDSSFRLGVLAT